MSLRGQYTVYGTVQTAEGTPVPLADVYEKTTGRLNSTDENGSFAITDLPAGTYQILIYSFEYNTYEQTVVLADTDKQLNIQLKALSSSLSAVEIRARRKEIFSLKRLNSIEGTAIYEGKKSEVVLLDQVVGNLAANNPRQIYAQVAGLNIYENNDAGLQLNIGGRGLDPNRTANFNTRQNGYDISADVLGYPESYYTPTAEALTEIQVVRGAASLQYGTQFGGLVNFKIKKPAPSKKVAITLSSSYGSYGQLTTFTDIGGTIGKFSYYGYYNYKTGDGYRPNSGFNSHNAYAYLRYDLSAKSWLSIETTYLDYLAQQPGGLTDTQFESDPTQSNRERNWFSVDWRLYNLQFNHQFGKQTKFNLSVFALDASRNAIGFRGNPKLLNTNPILELDEQRSDGSYINARDIISGTFKNWGAESRIIHTYNLGKQKATLLLGAKIYKSANTSVQGPGSTLSDADFEIQSDIFPDYPNQSEFEFPNFNMSLFGEHIFRIAKNFSLTPGFRIEHIKTQSIGTYRLLRYDAAGNEIYREDLSDDQQLSRTFALLGLGASYKIRKDIELYGNLSQNYRSVTFADIRTVSPTFIIDPDISDEKGFTADVGLRGRVGNQFNYDAGFFGLLYDNRIGIILDDRANRVRKNIGTAFIYGLESYGEWNVTKSIDPEITDRTVSIFSNISVTGSRYTSSEENNIEGKKVEFIPLLNLKAGLKVGYKDFLMSVQWTKLTEQYTDAENSERPAPGDSREGIVGTIPGYQILDISGSYTIKSLTLNCGITNVLNSAYYTRRATGYPGPGIIPSDGRAFYIGASIKI